MAGGVVAEAALGAALGVAIGKLFKSIVKATQGAARFSSNLIHLQDILKSIKPTMEEIESFNRILEPPPHEKEAFTALLIKGEKLIEKCTKVKWWDPFGRCYYSMKLNSFEAQLLKFFQIIVPAFLLREAKSISVRMREENVAETRNEIAELKEKIDEIGRNMLKLMHEIRQFSGAAAEEINVSLTEVDRLLHGRGRDYGAA